MTKVISYVAHLSGTEQVDLVVENRVVSLLIFAKLVDAVYAGGLDNDEEMILVKAYENRYEPSGYHVCADTIARFDPEAKEVHFVGGFLHRNGIHNPELLERVVEFTERELRRRSRAPKFTLVTKDLPS
jgi:hypothetical protein